VTGGRWLDVLWLWFRSVFFTRYVDAELDDEFSYHIDQLTEQNVARGMAPEVARQTAIAAMDGVARHKEQCRDARRTQLFDQLRQDLRYALRQARRNVAFTVVVVLVLALATAGNTAIFSVARAALAPLPIPAPDRAVMVWSESPARNWHQFPASMPDVRDWRASGVFGSLAPLLTDGFNLHLPGRTERIEGVRTTPDFFAVLGGQAARGHLFADADGQHAIVISDRLWRATFNSDPGVVGTSVVVDGVPCSIVGVLAPAFPRFSHEDVYAPLAPAALASGRGTRNFTVIGRLVDGVSFAVAQQRMREVSATLAREYPGDDGGITVALQRIQDAYVQDASLILNLLIASVLCGLLVASANIASLLLARGVVRRRELAIRTALGGGQWRLTRQLVTEHLVLAVAAGVVAIIPAWAVVRFIVSYHLTELPNIDQAGLNASALAFNFGVASGAGLLCGIAPAWFAARNDVNTSLKATGAINAASHQWLRKLFVVGQIAITGALLVAGAVVLRSFLDVVAELPGYNPAGVLTTRVALAEAQYASPERQAAFFGQLVERATLLPGVTAASVTREMPTSDDFHGGGLILPSDPDVRPEKVPIVLNTSVDPGYFGAMEIPLGEGRSFTAHDTKDTPPVAIVDRWTARKYWPDQAAVGQRFKLGRKQPWLEIIGVAGDVEAPMLVRFLKGRIGQVYRPLAQDPYPAMSLVLRTGRDEAALIPSVRSLVRDLDPDQPVFATETLSDARAAGRRVLGLIVSLLNGLAALALLLASVGLYGTVAYDVRQRTREFGLRISLGAEPAHLLTLVLRRGVLLLAIGLALGLLAAAAGIRLVSNAVYGIQVSDPTTLTLAVGLLTVAGTVAAYVPARRVMRISPVVALRSE